MLVWIPAYHYLRAQHSRLAIICAFRWKTLFIYFKFKAIEMVEMEAAACQFGAYAMTIMSLPLACHAQSNT